MQTFLPYPDYRRSAKALDRQRLGKQRVECFQIARALHDPTAGWNSHPAVTMWRGHGGALLEYMQAMIDEWVRRGYKNNMTVPRWFGTATDHPSWMGCHEFHLSHQANLVRKLPEHYGRMHWQVNPSWPYLWPSTDRNIHMARVIGWRAEAVRSPIG